MSKKNVHSLTLQFIPYGELEGLNSEQKINKLLKIVKTNKIILLEGRLRPEEEAELIRKTMSEINENFKGIELSAINPSGKDRTFFESLKTKLVNFLLGNRHGLTIVGPAKVIKEIKQDPDKIQLFMEDFSRN